MALPPIVVATLQSAVIAAISNVVAQVITAQTEQMALKLDPVPILQFFLYALVSTPPNFLWQDLLESTFPAYHGPSPSTSASAAGAKKEPATDREKLNKTNTLIKTILDQTVGAAANTLMFSTFMHGIRSATVINAAGAATGLRYDQVRWDAVWTKTKGEFWPILVAGWRFWPFVSIINFVFLTSVEARNLVGSLAGLGWGVYMSLFAGK